MGIESVAFLFSKAFWDHDEHDVRTQYYYIVAVILYHNSNSKWRQWCCEKFQKSQFCTQSRQNNISNVRIPFPSWAPQRRLCLWIPVPHSSKSLQLHPGAKIYLGKGTPVGIPAPAEGPCDSTWYNGQKKVKSLCQICLTWSQFTLNFSSRKPHIPPLTTSSEKPVYRTSFICSGPGCHTLYISGHPNFMNLSAFLWPSSPGLFFFFLLVGVAIAPAKILWHAADDDTIQSWYLSGWQRPYIWALSTDLWQVSRCWFLSVRCWFWQGKAVAPDMLLSHLRLMCCCKTFVLR